MIVAFVRRQSPDWSTLSNEYREGKSIDPKRYVPDHKITGFPSNIVDLIKECNKLFSIDYFKPRKELQSYQVKM